MLFQLPKAHGRPFQLQISKNNFSEPEKLFFDFPLQTPLRAGSELFRCFSSCPKRNCNGRPFRLANFKKQLFRAWKVVFWFSPPDTLESRQWAFQVLFQLPKAQLQWETRPRSQKGSGKLPPPHPRSHVWTRLVPQKLRELRILMERGEVINSEFRFSEAR